VSVDPRSLLRTATLHQSNSPLGRDYWLGHCEGFVVESPTGKVGVVDGARFGSRIDRPDLLEIEIGRLRPSVLLVPVEDVVDISPREERIALSADPRLHPYRDLAHELLDRLRGKLPVSPA
jgi:hypothetical protein